MVDIVVARDKLAGFETADEIAGFLISQGVVGIVGNTKHCAISEWMQEVTGDANIYIYGTFLFHIDSAHGPLEHTPAMAEFVGKFDIGDYPDLLEDNR